MSLEELTAALAGTIVAPGDSEWDAARVFHSGIGEPALVVRPQTVDDVQAAVRYAAGEELPVLVRSGGHSAWGELPGGMTIDLRALAGVDVDGDIVRVGGGARWGEIAAVLADHGLGVSSGDTASVGVGGLTLGGGIGWMVRAWGLAADQLVGVQLVTAAGEVIEATDASHPDLLWALRGGGGNFGVVTRFDFRAHRLPGVVFATLAIDGDSRAAMRAMRETLRDAPRELTVTYMDVPAMDPSAPAGASITACWIGDEEGARAALAPLLHSDGVREVELALRPYPEILLEVPAYDPAEPMPGFIGGNTLLHDLGDESIERLAAFRESNEASVLFFRSLGGAFADVPQHKSAFPSRDATWFVMAGAFDVPGLVDDEVRTEIESAWATIESAGAGVYGNFAMTNDASLTGKMYPPPTMARLAAVKRAWDPQNLFARNHNVAPA